MGKTARWFRSLLGGGGGKKDSKDSSKEKKKWGFVKSFRDKDRQQQPPPPTTRPASSVDERRGSYRERSSSSSTTTYFDGDTDPNKHAIAVAAATAAVAEAAVAAAHAAAAVVKLTSSGRCTSAYVSENGGIRKDVWAAVKIQSAFRGYLARRALKALKGLVKLQALVRGHIVRKKTCDEMRWMQAVVRVQSRARAGRSHSAAEVRHPINKRSLSHHPGPATLEKYERNIRSNSARNDRISPLKRNTSRHNSRDTFDWEKTQPGRNYLDRRVDDRSWDYYRDTKTRYGTTDDDKSDKILEIDSGKPHYNHKHWNSSQSSQQAVVLDRLSFKDSPSKDSTTAQLSSSSQSSGEVQSKIRVEDELFCTAENSPQFYSAGSIPGSSRRGPFTPTKSDCSRSFASVYSDHPNYMANTESSKAKVRSQSAPKQRLEFEKSSSARRYNPHVHGFGEVRPSTGHGHRASTVQSSFTSKAYPGSGRLDRLGMPIQNELVSSSGVYRNRY